MTRYRWLDTDRPVVSVARSGVTRGMCGRVLVLPSGGRTVANALALLDGRTYVVPCGCLRSLEGAVLTLVSLTPAMLAGSACLLCGRTPTQDTHFPIARGMGGRSKAEDDKLPRVRLCVECHIGRLHTEADRAATDALIERAPIYWKHCGCWEDCRGIFEQWLEYRRYKLALLDGSACSWK